MLVVSDSSALIALAGIQQRGLLKSLFAGITVPPAVAREVAPSVALPEWVIIERPQQPVGTRILEHSLGLGESETISLALEKGADFVVLDDKPARRLAAAIGLAVIGTVGVLMRAEEKGLVQAVRPHLDALRARSFRISSFLYDIVLTESGEP